MLSLLLNNYAVHYGDDVIAAFGVSFHIAQGVLFISTIIIANSVLGLHGIIFSMTIAGLLTFLLGISLYFYKKDTSLDTKVAV